jgi:hypothetical protein
MTMMTDYEALKAVGHSPQKAAEIILDAKRGIAHARGWLASARRVANGAVPVCASQVATQVER